MMPQTKGLLIDMDGVIYRENQLLPKAAEFIHHLIETSTPFVFVTNNSAPTPEDLVVKLNHLGIHGISARHFYTAAMNTAEFLAENHPCCTAFVMGDAGLTLALQKAGIPNDSIRPTYVVVGEGMQSTEKLSKAHELIEKGARLVATNPDNWCPVKKEVTRPGAGALAAYLEASTGQRAYFLGKPNPYMFQRARRLLQRHTEEVMMVGDTMETDIRGAIEVGMQACLVLTGSTRLEDLRNYVYQPTCVLEGVDELLEELRGSGTSSSRMQFLSSVTSAVHKKPGAKHPDQRVEIAYPRPRPAMTK
ncbi:HAD-IIA family hydrolase [Prosthecobacter sp.]|uniref:HAD-IIA family hydrolase n=1 Tax=Prosthecobacter sp. TaxID=1965333 RepID=UPI00378477BB